MSFADNFVSAFAQARQQKLQREQVEQRKQYHEKQLKLAKATQDLQADALFQSATKQKYEIEAKYGMGSRVPYDVVEQSPDFFGGPNERTLPLNVLGPPSEKGAGFSPGASQDLFKLSTDRLPSGLLTGKQTAPTGSQLLTSPVPRTGLSSSVKLPPSQRVEDPQLNQKRLYNRKLKALIEDMNALPADKRRQLIVLGRSRAIEDDPKTEINEARESQEVIADVPLARFHSDIAALKALRASIDRGDVTDLEKLKIDQQNLLRKEETEEDRWNRIFVRDKDHQEKIEGIQQQIRDNTKEHQRLIQANAKSRLQLNRLTAQFQAYQILMDKSGGSQSKAYANGSGLEQRNLKDFADSKLYLESKSGRLGEGGVRISEFFDAMKGVTEFGKAGIEFVWDPGAVTGDKRFKNSLLSVESGVVGKLLNDIKDGTQFQTFVKKQYGDRNELNQNGKSIYTDAVANEVLLSVQVLQKASRITSQTDVPLKSIAPEIMEAFSLAREHSGDRNAAGRLASEKELGEGERRRLTFSPDGYRERPEPSRNRRQAAAYKEFTENWKPGGAKDNLLKELRAKAGDSEERFRQALKALDEIQNPINQDLDQLRQSLIENLKAF